MGLHAMLPLSRLRGLLARRWDYGYQITGMGNRTIIVDNNTWNNTHIATVGRAMASNESEAYKIMRRWGGVVLITTSRNPGNRWRRKRSA